MSKLAVYAIIGLFSLVSLAGVISVLKNQGRAEFNAEVHEDSKALSTLNSHINAAGRTGDKEALEKHQEVDKWQNGLPALQCYWSCPWEAAQRLAAKS